MVFKYGFFFCLLFGFSFASASTCRLVPAEFEDHRIYIRVVFKNEVLRFYSDSGGGVYPFVYHDTAAKLGMAVESSVEEDGLKIGFSTFPQEFAAQNIPVPSIWNSKVRVFQFQQDGKDEPSQFRFFLGDGFLGARFFGDHVWNFNYRLGQLSYCDDFKPGAELAPIAMQFKTVNGEHTTHQPRIAISVDGEEIQVLFDTGATSYYPPEAIAQIRPPRAYVATSFIRKSIAERWVKQNPTWRTIHGGDRFSADGFLIEVPDVKVAGHSTGPVWFATREDEIYDKYSDTFMDANIDGAVGGNVFKSFEIIADYPKGLLYIQ